MKNIFSKTTEKRTQNGPKTDSKRTNYGIRILIFAFLTLGFGQAWAGDETYGNGKVIYLDISNGSTTNGWRKDQASESYKIKMYYWDSDESGNIIGEYCCTRIGSSNVYYTTTNNDWVRYVQALRCAGSCGAQHNYSNRVSCSSRSYNHDNCIVLPSDRSTWWDTWVPTWTCYVPDITSASLSNASVVYGGDGTSGNPYQIKIGSTLSVDASAVSAVPSDNAPTKQYEFYRKTNAGSRTKVQDYSSTSNYYFTSSSTAGTTYEIDVVARNANNSNYGGTATSSKIYYITVDPIYAILGGFNSWTHSASTWDLVDQGSNNWDATFTLEKGTHEFKVVYNSAYYGKGTSSYTTVTRASNSVSSLATGDGIYNLKITADVTGPYTFRFNSSSNNLTVTFPTKYQINFGIGSVKGNSKALYAYTDGVDANRISSGDYVAAGTQVTFYLGSNEPANVTKTGYTYRGYYGDAAGSTSQLSYQTAYTINSVSANTTIYACFYENDYYITPYIEGQGSVSPNGQNGHIATPVSFTATPGTGYKFDGWTERGGSALTIASPSATTTNVTTTAAATLQANFSPRWSVLGSGAFGGWSAYDTHLFDGYNVVSSKDVGYNTITLDANTSYEIKTYDRQTTIFYGGSANQDIDYAHSGAENEYTIATTADPKSVFIHSAAAGSYTLNWNLTDKKIAVVYPTSLFITSGQKTEGQDDNAGGSFTAVDDSSKDVKGGKFVADNASVIFSATPNTGYTFDGWYTNEACTDGKNASNPMTVSSITTDKTVYAKFVPKTYTVTLTRVGEGYGSGGDASATATFNAALPIATMPTAAQGYCFMGFYSETGGNGRRFIDPSGNWITNAGDTISDGKWILDDDITLYAYYKEAQITGITFSPGNIVAPEATVSVTATIEPTPVGPTTICWRVLYSNDNPLDPQPTFTSVSGGTVSFPAHSASGSYKVEATLRKGTGCGGEEIHTFTAPFQVAGDHTVTVQYKCGSEVIAPSTTVTGKPLEWTEVGVSNIYGYIFSGWSAGDGVTIKDGEGSSNPTHIKAIYDGYLTANYTKIDYIYFKNTMGWEHVDVYFYTSDKYWDDTEYGSGSNHEKKFKNGDDENHKPHWDQKRGRMTHLEGTDIWYFDAGSIGCANWSNIVFNANTQNEYDWFSATELVRRGDFNKGTPMFVPADKTTYNPILKNTNAKYYNKGYWINYLGERTGYTLEIYNSAGNTLLKSIKFLSETKQMPMEVKVDLEENQTYKFQLRRDNDIIYGNTGTMTYENHGQDQPWKFESGKGKCTFTSTVAGDYTFHLSYSKVASENEYHLRIGIDIPIQTGDYRVIYKDNVHTGYKPSAVVPKVNNGKDTVSFFIRPNSSPEMKIQQATVNASTGAITWSAGTDISSSLTSLTKDSVYNICLQMNGSGAISVENVKVYTGNFYIRTDAANSKWDNYRSDPDHLMTYSEYSITHGGYSHYYCHWVTTADTKRKNVKFCIANDYSPCISDTLTRETASGEWANINSFIDGSGNLLRSANVRFMWNQHDNTIKRAYLDPAKNDDNFLVLASTDSKIANKSEVVQTAVVFSDNENWIYEANVKAKPGAKVKLVATWGDATTIVQYFKGTSSTTETLITGSTDDWYDIRLVYDYKTNRLIAAMLPSGNHTTSEPINADVMFIREHQGDISQVTFTEDGALTDIKIAYGVMRFNKWTLNNKDKDTHLPLASPASPYERAMYFISFPFEVKLSEVFGIGNYGQDWIVEYYDGAERARTGWWEGEPGFWRYVWNRKDFVLQPNVGYLLQLELASFGEASSAWDNDNEQIELFFPSSGNLGTITNTTVNCTIPEHACTINRHETEGLPDTPDNPHTSYNRTIFDSHWNVMSVPTYVNATPNDWSNTTWTTKIGPKFLYTWNPDDNTLTATSGTGFAYHAMHAYMVQYGGNVQWVTSGTGPASIVARDTYAEQPKEVEFRIEIQQNEKMVDQTFVIMSNDDEINANFQFGEDMSKDFNARNANIYTMTADNVASAGNTLPMSNQTTIVPVGVSINSAGDYTFAIPEGTEGIGVTLVDNETGVRTSLSALSYTVNLQPGDYTGRFVLEISPIAQTPTGVETVTGEGLPVTGVRKVMIDGILYIVKDGKMYDARGARVE